MKNLIYIFILLSIISCRENKSNGEPAGQEVDTTAIAKDQDTIQKVTGVITNIEDIRKEHAYILSKAGSKSLDSTSVSYNCNGEKEGQIIYFYEENQLRLIRHVYNEYSHFSATDEYFIKDAELFFVFNDQLAWNFAGQNQTRDNITERRYYIINIQPVHCLEKKFSVNSNEKDPPESESVDNKEIECTLFEEVLEDYKLLFKFREQNGDIECLE